MNAKKILSIVIVIALVVCAAAAIVKNNESTELKTQLAEVSTQNAELEANASAAADLQAQLDEANAKLAELEGAANDSADLQAQLDEAAAKIAELEAAVEAAADTTELQAQIDLYKPYYEKQIVIAYDGGAVMLDDVMAQYQQYANAYAQYGIDLVAYGMDGQIKQNAAGALLDSAVMSLKAAELGLDQLDEATIAGMTEEAAANYENYVQSAIEYFTDDELTAEEIRTNAVEYLASENITEESMLDSLMQSYIQEAAYNYITADVTVNDEEIQAAYDALVAEQMDSYSNDSNYNSARNDGKLIVWNPEGYRAVKHVLVKFSDEQSASLSEMKSTLSALNTELEAAMTPAEETEAETTEEAAEETTEEPRSIEEIEADIATMQANIDALYAELLPKAEEVIEKFNAGTAFADLIAEYNEDPGMTNEPIATNGYAVAAASTTWDPAFRDGAMSIAEVGGISEPVYGSYGIHVIYYESDIPAGAVALENVKAELEPQTLESKISATYNSTLDAWIAEFNPVYHFENLG